MSHLHNPFATRTSRRSRGLQGARGLALHARNGRTGGGFCLSKPGGREVPSLSRRGTLPHANLFLCGNPPCSSFLGTPSVCSASTRPSQFSWERLVLRHPRGRNPRLRANLPQRRSPLLRANFFPQAKPRAVPPSSCSALLRRIPPVPPAPPSASASTSPHRNVDTQTDAPSTPAQPQTPRRIADIAVPCLAPPLPPPVHHRPFYAFTDEPLAKSTGGGLRLSQPPPARTSLALHP